MVCVKIKEINILLTKWNNFCSKKLFYLRDLCPLKYKAKTFLAWFLFRELSILGCMQHMFRNIQLQLAFSVSEYKVVEWTPTQFSLNAKIWNFQQNFYYIIIVLPFISFRIGVHIFIVRVEYLSPKIFIYIIIHHFIPKII